MIKRSILWGVFVLVIGVFQAGAQTPAQAKELYAQLKPGLCDTARLDILLTLARFQATKEGHLPQNTDSSTDLIKQAELLNIHLKSDKYEAYIHLVKGILYRELAQKQKAKAYVEEAIREIISTGKYYSLLGNCYIELSLFYASEDSTFRDRENSLAQAAHYFHLAGDDEEAGNAFVIAARGDLKANRTDSAFREFQQALVFYEPAHTDAFIRICSEAATVESDKANYTIALSYLIRGLKKTDSTTDKDLLDNYYYKFASVYFNSRLFEEALFWSRKGAALTRSVGKLSSFYTYMHQNTQILLAENKPAEALASIQKAVAETPPDPKSAGQQRSVTLDLGKCYLALHLYGKAEQCYIKLDKLFKSYDEENKKRDFLYYNNLVYHYTSMAMFYCAIKKYNKAGNYIDLVKSVLHKSAYPSTRLRALYWLEFTIDSAKGNFLSAIDHYQAYKLIDDSLFNATKANQMSELDIQYKAGENEKNIVLLQTQRKQQRSELQKVNLQRNLVLSGTALLFVIAGLAYRGYRLKQNTHLQLRQKQKAINRQNSMLASLLNDKEKLIGEKDQLLEVKEILMKEIHHRVKNNLHMISSLLESQTAYLHDEALDAVQKSQHRVQAISLIHHKLYLSPTLKAVDMAIYLREMVGYLRDNFVTRESILFRFDVESIALDVVQAVPVGLIVNEAITNSIKYAFPSPRQGQIEIALRERAPHECLLSITDNGLGLSNDFEMTTSLGINLIKGLSKNLGGQLCISSHFGARIELIFDHHPETNGIS